MAWKEKQRVLRKRDGLHYPQYRSFFMWFSYSGWETTGLGSYYVPKAYKYRSQAQDYCKTHAKEVVWPS